MSVICLSVTTFGSYGKFFGFPLPPSNETYRDSSSDGGLVWIRRHDLVKVGVKMYLGGGLRFVEDATGMRLTADWGFDATKLDLDGVPLDVSYLFTALVEIRKKKYVAKRSAAERVSGASERT